MDNLKIDVQSLLEWFGFAQLSYVNKNKSLNVFLVVFLRHVITTSLKVEN